MFSEINMAFRVHFKHKGLPNPEIHTKLGQSRKSCATVAINSAGNEFKISCYL